MGHGEIEAELVEKIRRHAGVDVIGQQVERFGRQPPGPAHAIEGVRPVELDLTVLPAGRCDRVDECHGELKPDPLNR